MTHEHEEGCPAREDEGATCVGCPYGARLSAWIADEWRRRGPRCLTCGVRLAEATAPHEQCGLCAKGLTEPDMGETRIVDVRLVRLRGGSWHASVDGELVGEAGGVAGALDMVRDWFLEARR